MYYHKSGKLMCALFLVESQEIFVMLNHFQGYYRILNFIISFNYISAEISNQIYYYQTNDFNVRSLLFTFSFNLQLFYINSKLVTLYIQKYFCGND